MPVWEYKTREKNPIWRVLDEEMTAVVEGHSGKGQFEYNGVLIDTVKGYMRWPETQGYASLRKKGVKPLVMPSFSTAIFGFDTDVAAKIACEVVGEFLNEVKGTKIEGMVDIVLLDFSPEGRKTTKTLEAFRKYMPRITYGRFTLRLGDVADPTQRGACFVLANAANSRLYGGPKTGGINRSIHEAAGPALAIDTTRLHGTHAEVSTPYSVPLSPSSPLFKQGVEHVVHVVGPNMNPNRPNYLSSYEHSAPLLKKCYENLLREYARILVQEVK